MNIPSSFSPSLNRRSLLKGLALGAGALASKIPVGRRWRQPAPPLAATTAGKVRGYVDQRHRRLQGHPLRRRHGEAPLSAARAARPVDGRARCPRLGAAGSAGGRPGPGDRRHAGGHLFRRVQRQPTPMSEDCLHLNVWTPGLRDGGKRPVMVYSTAAAYSSGSANATLYDGVRLCRRGDVVVVTRQPPAECLRLSLSGGARRPGVRRFRQRGHARPDAGAALGARQHRGIRRRSRQRARSSASRAAAPSAPR